MKDAHLDPETILAYVEEARGVDRAAVDAHVVACAQCARRLRSARLLRTLLADPARYGDDQLARVETQFHAEERAAEAVWTELARVPVDQWSGFLLARPDRCTEAVLRRAIAQAEAEVDRRPRQALAILAVAETVAPFLRDPGATALVCGDLWKQRANALRQLGTYPEALRAADVAAAWYDEVLVSAFERAQVDVVRAAIHFKMADYGRALAAVRAAARVLGDFGCSRPLAKTMILEAMILAETGAVAEALERFTAAVPILDTLGDEVDGARVVANIGECHLRLGALGLAEQHTAEAMRRFAALGMDSEGIRTWWSSGVVLLERGRTADGIARLEEAARAFDGLGMHADAAYVKLDLVEALLAGEEWTRAAETARDAAELFARSGATAKVLEALASLRGAVERMDATPALVRSVRDFASAPGARPMFHPPR